MTVAAAVLELVADALPDATVYVNDIDTPFDSDDLVVFDSIVPPIPPDRYVVVRVGTGDHSAPAVASISDSGVFRPYVTSVGRDGLEARWLADRVQKGILDARPEADGWACGPIKHNVQSPPATDEAVQDRAVVYVVDQYAFLASRLPGNLPEPEPQP